MSTPEQVRLQRMPWLPPATRRLVLLLAVAVALPVAGTLGALNNPLQNPTAPWGVVSFELAGSTERQTALLNSWDGEQTLGLAFSIGLDFICAASFIALLALGCEWVGGKAGRAMACIVVAMGAAWMVQNILLADAVVFAGGSEWEARAIAACSVVKFLVMAASTVLIAGGAVARFARRG